MIPLPDEAQAALMARLDQMGLATTTHRHAPVFTVEEARALRGTLPGGHAKNLFLKDKKGQLFLAVVEETTPVDLKALEKAMGAARVSFGKPELLAEVLGVAPGSVTPFAAMNASAGSITVVLDEGLMAHEQVHFHPLRNDATTAIRSADLITFLTVLGHPPTFIDFRALRRDPI